MQDILGDLLSYAAPVALSPLPILAMVMLLLAPDGRRKGLAFLAGRGAALVFATLVLAALASRIESGGETRGWLRIGLGLGLVAGAVVVWRKDAPAEAPGWSRSIAEATPAAAARIGATLTLANVKELAFALGAAAIIAGAGLDAGRSALAVLAFAALGLLGVALPLLALVLGGDAARARLAAARDWLLTNQAVALAVVMLVIGTKLVGSGLAAL